MGKRNKQNKGPRKNKYPQLNISSQRKGRPASSSATMDLSAFQENAKISSQDKRQFELCLGIERKRGRPQVVHIIDIQRNQLSKLLDFFIRSNENQRFENLILVESAKLFNKLKIVVNHNDRTISLPFDIQTGNILGGSLKDGIDLRSVALRARFKNVVTGVFSLDSEFKVDWIVGGTPLKLQPDGIKRCKIDRDKLDEMKKSREDFILLYSRISASGVDNDIFMKFLNYIVSSMMDITSNTVDHNIDLENSMEDSLDSIRDNFLDFQDFKLDNGDSLIRAVCINLQSIIMSYDVRNNKITSLLESLLQRIDEYEIQKNEINDRKKVRSDIKKLYNNFISLQKELLNLGVDKVFMENLNSIIDLMASLDLTLLTGGNIDYSNIIQAMLVLLNNLVRCFDDLKDLDLSNGSYAARVIVEYISSLNSVCSLNNRVKDLSDSILQMVNEHDQVMLDKPFPLDSNVSSNQSDSESAKLSRVRVHDDSVTLYGDIVRLNMNGQLAGRLDIVNGVLSGIINGNRDVDHHLEDVLLNVFSNIDSDLLVLEGLKLNDGVFLIEAVADIVLDINKAFGVNSNEIECRHDTIIINNVANRLDLDDGKYDNDSISNDLIDIHGLIQRNYVNIQLNSFDFPCLINFIIDNEIIDSKIEKAVNEVCFSLYNEYDFIKNIFIDGGDQAIELFLKLVFKINKHYGITHKAGSNFYKLFIMHFRTKK